MAGKITTKILDATDANNKPSIKKLGFDTHGLVVRKADGSVSHAENGHNFGKSAIEGWIKEAL